MTRKMLLAIDAGTPQQNDAITLYIQGKGWHVWHWIDNLWLLSGVPDEVSPSQLYFELAKIPTLGGSRMIVMTIDGEPSYYGNVAKDAWQWMRKNWGEPDPFLPQILMPHRPTA